MKQKNRDSILEPAIPKPEPPIPGWKTQALERREILRQKRCARSAQKSPSHAQEHGRPSRVAIFSILVATLRPL